MSCRDHETSRKHESSYLLEGLDYNISLAYAQETKKYILQCVRNEFSKLITTILYDMYKMIQLTNNGFRELQEYQDLK